MLCGSGIRPGLPYFSAIGCRVCSFFTPRQPGVSRAESYTRISRGSCPAGGDVNVPTFGSSSSARREGRTRAWGRRVSRRSTRVAARFRSLLLKLHEEISDSGRLGELLDGGYVFTPSDSSILYDICDVVDSLYFESRSAYEITGHFVTRFCRVILDRSVSENELVGVLQAAGQDVSWIVDLRENRNLFSHETAPWIALKIESREPPEFQLVVMKDNLHEFDDPTRFITQDALVDMWDGYEASLMALKSWLEELLEAAN